MQILTVGYTLEFHKLTLYGITRPQSVTPVLLIDTL